MSSTSPCTRYSDSGSASAKRASKAAAPSGADQRVRILAVGQEQEAHLRGPRAPAGSALSQRSPGGRAAGTIAVEAEHDLAGDAEQRA